MKLEDIRDQARKGFKSKKLKERLVCMHTTTSRAFGQRACNAPDAKMYLIASESEGPKFTALCDDHAEHARRWGWTVERPKTTKKPIRRIDVRCVGCGSRHVLAKKVDRDILKGTVEVAGRCKKCGVIARYTMTNEEFER